MLSDIVVFSHTCESGLDISWRILLLSNLN